MTTLPWFSFKSPRLYSAAQEWELQEAAFGDWTSSLESDLTISIVDTRPTTTAKLSKMSQTPSQQGMTYDGAYGSPQPIYYNNSGQGYDQQGQMQQQVSNYAAGPGGAGGDQPPVETEPPRAKIASPMVGVGLMAALTFLTVLCPMIVFLVLYTDATTIF